MKNIKDLKLLDLKKLSSLNQPDLKKELNNLEKEYFTTKMKKQLGEVKQTHLIKFLRRNIARIKTLAKAKWYNLD